MTLDIEARYPPTSREELDEFEHTTGKELPPEYREFLLHHNGGRPGDNVVEAPDLGELVVNDFLGIQPGDQYDLARELDVYDGRIPRDALPFAEDPAGNLFLLSLAGDSKGAVFFWDHENEPEEEGIDWSEFDNIHPVAGSLEEFLSRIRRPEP